jgi:hypothetical protein
MNNNPNESMLDLSVTVRIRINVTEAHEEQIKRSLENSKAADENIRGTCKRRCPMLDHTFTLS